MMNETFLDFHTHKTTPLRGETTVRSVDLQADRDMDGIDGLYSAGIHPWHVEDAGEQAFGALRERAVSARCVAIGEIGLDRCASADMAVQEKAFRRQLALAQELQRPVVIHCVRAWSELLAEFKNADLQLPCAIHGFRGKPALAEQLLSKGFYLSFGFRYCRETLQACPSSRLFLETDADSREIVDLYREVALLRGTDISELKYACWRNFLKFRGDRR